MEIDHIFIFSNSKGKEADQLVKFGLIEGSNRIHKGQGTTNRKFYFENFFLEVLWVINEEEINESPAKETQLGKRANYKKNGFSRFGLCLLNTAETDELFEGAQIYQPNYFPPEMSIDILPNKENPKLPWTFRLPYRGGKKEMKEPRAHSNQIRKLTKVEFEINELDLQSNFISSFAKEKSIIFKPNLKSNLILEFDYAKQNKVYRNEGLDLTIKY